MPDRYLEDPVEMAKAVKHVTSAVRYLTAFTVAGILWVTVLTGLFYQERMDHQRSVVEQRHQDCVAALSERDQSRQRDLDQWKAAADFVRAVGLDPHGEQGAFAGEFINEQYDNMPPPPACQ